VDPPCYILKEHAMIPTAEATPAASASSSELRAQLTGTWRLMSAEDRNEQGEWVPYTFGNPPSGYFIYDGSGYASVQIMTTPPVQIATPDTPTPDEALQIFNGFISYYGPWTIDETTITVMAEGDLDPSQVGQPQARPYTLSGDTLTIGSEAAGYIRTLQRVV
jgi:hypothetical protein